MADIVLGIGTSHSPLLTFDASLWESYATRDLVSTRMNLSDGRYVTYQELLAERGGPYADISTPAHFQARGAACQAALDRIADDIAAVNPDVVVVVTDDHSELFRLSNMPAVSIYYGDEIKTMPRASVAHLQFEREKDYFSQMTKSYAMDRSHTFAADPAFAKELIERMIDKDVDMGAAATIDDPVQAGLGHGVGFVIQRLFRGKSIPVVPVLLNTYYPPNAPSAAARAAEPSRTRRWRKMSAVGAPRAATGWRRCSASVSRASTMLWMASSMPYCTSKPSTRFTFSELTW